METNQERKERTPSELEKALDLLASLEQGELDQAYHIHKRHIVYTQLEKAYEQLQANGVNVSEKLERTRIEIMKNCIDSIISTINITDIKEADIKNLYHLTDDGSLSVPTLRRSIALLEEYIRKVDPDHPSLTEYHEELG